MNQKTLEAVVADKLDTSKAHADRILTAVLESIEQLLVEDRRLKIANLGVFEVINRPARNYRNPKTGETVPKPATNVIKFKPWKNLRDAVN